MKTAMLCVQGNWAHFKKPETNNNPLTHDFLTKTALLGMIGAVLGKERDAMKGLFPRLSEDLRYGVALLRPVKKQTWSFTLRRFAADRSKLERACFGGMNHRRKHADVRRCVMVQPELENRGVRVSD